MTDTHTHTKRTLLSLDETTRASIRTPATRNMLNSVN